MVKIADLKMTREALCAAQSALHAQAASGALAAQNYLHSKRLQEIINEIDRLRPLGPDGQHGSLHTKHCGCYENNPFVPYEAVRLEKTRLGWKGVLREYVAEGIAAETSPAWWRPTKEGCLRAVLRWHRRQQQRKKRELEAEEMRL